jgi:hypothetical protein
MDVHIDLEEKQLQTNEGPHVTALGKYCPYVEESLVIYWDNDMEAAQCIKWSGDCLFSKWFMTLSPVLLQEQPTVVRC